MDYPVVFAKDWRDVPEWMKANHNWRNAVSVDKLQKLQLKVKMCCSTCEEKVVEEILEVDGVFDVKAERLASKVIVLVRPGGVDEHEVLRKAKKVHKKARFVELDAKEKQKPQSAGGGRKFGGDFEPQSAGGVGGDFEPLSAGGGRKFGGDFGPDYSGRGATSGSGYEWRPPRELEPYQPYYPRSTLKGGRSFRVSGCTIL